MITHSLWTLAVGVLQSRPFPEPGEIDLTVGLGSSAVSAFFTTLIVGAILVAIAPKYVERTMAAVVDDPVGTFVYGLVVLVLVVLLAVVLIFSLVGIVLAIPGIFLTIALWSVGASIAFLAIADRLVGHADGWLVPLLVAGGINGGLALTGVGGLVSFCVGAAGFGAVMRGWLG